MMAIAERTTLTGIADVGDYVASVEAQSLLNDAYGETYFPTITLPDLGGQQGMMAPSPNTGNAAFRHVLEVAPNPAKEKATFRYRLPDSAEKGRLVVTTADGRTVQVFDLKELTGRIIWDTAPMEKGIYLYSLWAGTRRLSTKRLVILN